MPKRGSKRSRSRLPATGIGIMSLLDEDTGGLKVKPELIIVGALIFIAASVVGLIFFPA